MQPHATILSSCTVWDGRTRLDVVEFIHRRFDGLQSPVRTWEVWRRGRAVGVLPYDPVTDQLVVIEQFRLPVLLAGLDPVMLEIPCGFTDGTETAEQTAAREMQEEMGLAADRLEQVGRFALSAGGSDETVAIYAGRVTAPVAGVDGIVGYGGLATEHEDIRIRVIDAGAAIARALRGDFPNAVTSLALLWFASQRDRLRQAWLAA